VTACMMGHSPVLNKADEPALLTLMCREVFESSNLKPGVTMTVHVCRRCGVLYLPRPERKKN
jgi:hypothetical protein